MLNHVWPVLGGLTFKVRTNLHNIKVSQEAASADGKAANDSPEKISAIIEEDYYSAHQVFNVNEAGLSWKKMSDRTYINNEENSMPGCKAAWRECCWGL